MTAFEATVTPRMENLRHFAKKLTKTSSSADDLLQDTLLRALEKWALFDASRNVFPWLCTIMVRIHAGNNRRKSKRSQLPSVFEADTADILATVNACTEPSWIANAAATRLPLLSWIHTEILVLTLWEDYTIAEAGAYLEIAEGTARSRYQRAVYELRSLMGVENAS